MIGYISIHRKIWNNEIWNKENFSWGQAWIDLLLLANYKDKQTLFNGEVMIIKRGQFITSKRKLMRRWRWGNNRLKRFLSAISEFQQAKLRVFPKGVFITICNYDTYQIVDPMMTQHRPNDDSTLTTTNKDNKDNKDNKGNKEKVKDIERADGSDFDSSTSSIKFKNVYEKEFYVRFLQGIKIPTKEKVFRLGIISEYVKLYEAGFNSAPVLERSDTYGLRKLFENKVSIEDFSTAVKNCLADSFNRGNTSVPYICKHFDKLYRGDFYTSQKDESVRNIKKSKNKVRQEQIAIEKEIKERKQNERQN